MSYDPRRRRSRRRRHDPDPARRRSRRRHDPDPARRVYHRRGASAMTALKAAVGGIIGAVAGTWLGGMIKDKVDVNFNVMGKSINVADAAAGAAALAATPFLGRSTALKVGVAALGGAMLAKSDPASVSPPGVGWAISPEGLGL
ncbi:MAG: hypothetical protein RXR82_06075 [Nitrososphaeria archaeon]